MFCNREKYRKLYQDELAKQRAKLQAQKENDIDLYKTKLTIDKAHRHARARVKPFIPRKSLKCPSKAQLQKTGKVLYNTGKSFIDVLQKIDKAYSKGENKNE